MTAENPLRTRRWAVLAVLLAVVGIVALVVGVTGQQRPPQPAAAEEPATSSSPAPSGPSAPPPAAVPAPPSAAAADPVGLRIPTIDVSTDLMQLGLGDDGTVQVPPLGPDDVAGWYRNSPAPGAAGPAVLLGHVDSAQWGPGVFFDLGALTPGDEVEVARADGSVAVFAVDRVERYAKADFPTLEVYGNTADPQLRLITCGGAFDPAARSYEDNVVVYARLVSTRAA